MTTATPVPPAEGRTAGLADLRTAAGTSTASAWIGPTGVRLDDESRLQADGRVASDD